MGNSLEGFSVAGGEKKNNKLNAPVTKKLTERGSMLPTNKYTVNRPVCFAVSSMQGWRPSMEDTHILEPSLKVSTELDDHAFFGVYDGHGGSFTSQYISENFSRILTKRAEWKIYTTLSQVARAEVSGIELLKDALTNAHLDLDKELELIYVKQLSTINLAAVNRKRNRRNSKISDEKLDKTTLQNLCVDRSGSTAVSVLLTPTHIICSNAGDSRAILCRDGKVIPLSFDHKPVNATEISRVYAAGGFVQMKRIDGDLAVSRGFGDFRYKLNLDVPVEKQKVVAVPEITVFPRDEEKDEFIVLGCDGIWDVLDNVTCTDMVKRKFNKGKTDIGQMCEELLDECLKKDSRDNMTICLVSLPRCKLSE